MPESIAESVLFLDDDADRRHAFVRREPRAMLVRTAAEAIDALRSGGPWEDVHLDHDLSGETYQDSDSDDCGMEVVRWILLNKPDVRTFVVHTHNEIAAPVMVAALESAGYRVLRIPFRFEKTDAPPVESYCVERRYHRTDRYLPGSNRVKLPRYHAGTVRRVDPDRRGPPANKNNHIRDHAATPVATAT